MISEVGYFSSSYRWNGLLPLKVKSTEVWRVDATRIPEAAAVRSLLKGSAEVLPAPTEGYYWKSASVSNSLILLTFYVGHSLQILT